MEQKLVYSTVVKLQAREKGQVPATMGRLAHGAFFDLIKSVDPDLAEALHNMQRKPFTVSPLYGLEVTRNGHAQVRQVAAFNRWERKSGEVTRNGHAQVRQGQGVWLRFTLLQSELFTAFTRYLLAPQRIWPTLRLGEIEFLIMETLTTPGSHEWAGYLDLNAVQTSQVSKTYEVSPANKITLDFVSPTVFSRGDKPDLGRLMDPFPTPDLLFGGLAATWANYLPGVFVPEEVRQYARETVVVGEYKMESKVYRFWKQPQIGATGRVTYILKDTANLTMRQQLNQLADLSFYSGVGYKTGMGMGQVRRIRSDE